MGGGGLDNDVCVLVRCMGVVERLYNPLNK